MIIFLYLSTSVVPEISLTLHSNNFALTELALIRLAEISSATLTKLAVISFLTLRHSASILNASILLHMI